MQIYYSLERVTNNKITKFLFFFNKELKCTWTTHHIIFVMSVMSVELLPQETNCNTNLLRRQDLKWLYPWLALAIIELSNHLRPPNVKRPLNFTNKDISLPINK